MIAFAALLERLVFTPGAQRQDRAAAPLFRDRSRTPTAASASPPSPAS